MEGKSASRFGGSQSNPLAGIEVDHVVWLMLQAVPET
jgi:hypothetical protein